MNAGLAYLLRRGARGKARQALRRMRTPKGAVAALFGTLLIGAVAGVQLWAMWFDPVPPASPETVRRYLPPMLLLLSGLGALSGRPLYFAPAEVDFLFPAPVGRRELLLYNLLSRLGVQLFSGLWVALFTARFAASGWNGAAATVLAFVFIYVAAQALALAYTAAETWLPGTAAKRVVRAALIAGGVFVAASAASSASAGGASLGPGRVLRALAEVPAVRVAGVVARPWAELFVAPDGAAGAMWAAACLGVLAGMVGLLMLLDVAYAERSLAVSAKVHARLQRMRSGGAYPVGTSRLRLRVPRLRLLGAEGALAWRQLTELARTPRALLVPLIGGGLWIGTTLFAMRDGGDVSGGATMIAVFCLLVPVLFSGHVTFDFRRDLDRMAFLRSLPLAPGRVAAGQVLPVALVFAAMQYLLLGLAAAFAEVPRELFWALALGIPPYAWAVVSVENGLFLLMPYRLAPGEDQRMQFMGKVMLAMFLKTLVVGLLVVAAGALAWGAWAATDSFPATLAAGTAGMALGCIPLTWGVGRAFAHFDFTRDTPA